MSLWLDGVQRAYPPLEGDVTADIAIVGGGIAGIASAYFLATAGARVVVLEARGVAEAASGRNAGFLLAGAAASAGARIHEDTRVESVTSGEARTARGSVRAGAILLCTNAYTGHLVPSRVRPVRGQMLATAPTAPVFARPAYAKRGYQYWRQTAD